MTKSTLSILFSLLIFSSYSQKKSTQKTFPLKIEGTVSNWSAKKIYLHHRDNDLMVTDSSTVNKGKFKFQSKLAEPTMYWFSLSKDPNQQPNIVFFADEAPVSASILGGDSLVYSTVNAGQTQKDYVEYKLMVNNFIMIQQRMQTDFNDAAQKGDANTQNAIKLEYENLNTQYMSGVKNFIKTHPKSAMSAFILANDLNNPSIPLSEIEECLTYIDSSLINNSNIKLVNKRMEDKRGTMVGYKATNFTQPNTEGKQVSLSDFKGKYVLIDFWASWCRPCRMENPNVVAAYNRYKDKGFTILGVSMDSNRDPWLAAIQQDNLTWTHVSDLKGWGNEVGKLYGVSGIPQNYLIDKEGKIVAKDLRGAALEEKLAEIIK